MWCGAVKRAPEPGMISLAARVLFCERRHIDTVIVAHETVITARRILVWEGVIRVMNVVKEGVVAIRRTLPAQKKNGIRLTHRGRAAFDGPPPKGRG